MTSRNKKGNFLRRKRIKCSKRSSARLKSWHELSDTCSDNAGNRSISANSAEINSASSSTSSDGNVISDISSWRVGRRIVELGHIVDQLKHCDDCGEPVHLINIDSETRYGFGSVLWVMCQCGVLNRIETNKSHRLEGNKRGPTVFDINTKAALGMVHSGVGNSHVSKFMSAIEVGGLHHTTMQKRQNEVGEHIQLIAKESCKQAIIEEQQLTAEQTSTAPPNESVKAAFKYDMGWQKRGSGRCYDSKSGVGTMIGNRSGKVCAYGVRLKDCRTCSYHKNKGNLPPYHKCYKNWEGSSKAMEPDVGGELVKEVEKENVTVDVIIMDDDCTTMAKIRKEIPHEIEKWSDINHTVKHLGNSLYSLQKKHKCLTTKVIKWIQKCFNYAIAQNKGNVDGCRSALKQIVPHAFGNHNMCGEWCGYLRDPDTYKHKSLPYGRNLQGAELQSELEAVFQVFVQNAPKIAPGGSTKDVESFNNMVASKAPKRCHYSSTDNLINRVDCAVAQKNLGMTYVNKVNVSLGISPGKVYESFALKQDKKRKRSLEYENNISVKRRKLDRKFSQKYDNNTKEMREGVTYRTSVAISHISDVTEIPPPREAPETIYISKEDLVNKVFCDIETTSLYKDADIVQIAAVSGSETFNQYIMPTKPIASSASAVTGLSSHGNVLFYQGKPVQTMSIEESLNAFISWLHNRQPCILIGHNFKRFDFPRIIRAFESCGMLQSLIDCVKGIVDTYPLFKRMYPDLEKYSQEFLVSTVVKEDYEAHNALGDVQSLQKLCEIAHVSDNQMVSCSVSTDSSINTYLYCKESQTNLESLSVLKEQKIVSKTILEKMAKSGLRLEHLKLAVTRSGFDGLTELLKEKVNGKARVTSTKRIVETLYNFLK